MSDFDELSKANRWQNLDLDRSDMLDFERALWIERVVTTKDWWNPLKGSNVLVLQGREKTDKEFSPVTIWSAAVSQFPWDPNECLCLYWFCGQFPEWDTQRATLFMLGQLLLHGSAALEVPDSRTLPSPTGEHAYAHALSYPKLTETFLRCVKEQLDHTKIIIVIDSVSIYQDGMRGPTLQHLFDSLVDVGKGSWDHRLRIVVTSPTTTNIA